MIFKHNDGTVVEMTAAEFAELGGLYGGDVESEAVVEGMAEATTDFKVGDKVEVIGVSVSERDEFIGETAVITNILDDGYFQIDERGCSIYPQSSLKLIEEEPEEVLSYENVKEGELFEVTDDGSNKFPTGTIVCSINSIQNDSLSSRFQDVVSGKTDFLKYNEIKRHTPEVLSEDNVKEGEYFVITGNSNGHNFAISEIVKAISYTDYRTFTAEHLDGSDWYYTCYTDVRRATDAEIAEATKPKFEIGEVVYCNGAASTIVSEDENGGDYWLKRIANGESDLAETKQLRHATEEEKSHLQTLIGREKDEYKVGDLVELLDGSCSGYRGCEGYIFEVNSVSHSYYHLKDNGNKINDMNTYYEASKLKLITPVEWRHDFVGGA